jgi:hypothetical protein
LGLTKTDNINRMITLTDEELSLTTSYFCEVVRW